ncbi:MAG: hypothetical protein J5I81_06465 [Nitrococcus mobilis]|nr:hypothetical protein [Nitrococcus mobilis]
MPYVASKTRIIALAASALAFAAGCAGTEANVAPYRVHHSEIQELETGYKECCTKDCCTKRRTNQPTAETTAVRFTLTSKQDIDTVRARLEQAFGFQAPDKPASAAASSPASLRQDVIPHHRTIPRSDHSVQARGEIGGHTGVIEIAINRDGNGSHLTILYDAGGKERFPPGEGFRRLVAAKIHAALHDQATGAHGSGN